MTHPTDAPGSPDVPAAPAPKHVPVLLERCLALLAPALERPGAVVVDATLGLGGHSEALLTRFPEVRLVGLDRDQPACDEHLATVVRRATDANGGHVAGVRPAIR